MKQMACLLSYFVSIVGPCYGAEAQFAQATGSTHEILHAVVSNGGSRWQHATMHDYAVAELALEKTKNDFGPYTLTLYKEALTNFRALKELQKPDGKINVHVSITSPEREEGSSVIKLPIRMGLLNYRVILSKRGNLANFGKIETFEDFLKRPIGVVDHWVTTKILQNYPANLVMSQHPAAIFDMLEKDRFIYLMRGANEAYVEIDSLKGRFPDLVVEPNLAIYIPLPYYMFVSTSMPALKERLTEGLERAIADGSFKKLFLRFYADSIQRANLANRKTIFVRNPYLRGDECLTRSELWYLSDPKLAKELDNNFH